MSTDRVQRSQDWEVPEDIVLKAHKIQFSEGDTFAITGL